MNAHFVLLQAYSDLRITDKLYLFFLAHPVISIIALVFALRGAVRWFLGVSKLRRAQNRYSDLLERHNALLESQNRLLQQHEDIISKLGEKYLS